MKKDWTDIIKEKMSESAITPPDDLWDSISSEFDTVISSRQRRNKRAVVWRWSSIAAILAAVIICGVYFYDINIYENSNILPTEEMILAENSTETQPSSLPCKNLIVREASEMNNTNSQTGGASNIQEIRDELPDPISDTLITEEEVIIPTVDSAIIPKSHTSQEEEVIEQTHESFPIATKAKPNKKTSVSLFASDMNLSGSKSDGDNFMVGDELSNNNNSSSYSKKEAHHKLPIRFGVSARVPINDYFSIGAGVSYSLLSSTITWSNILNHSYETEQTLHYIGIPVSVDYRLPSYRSFEFYLSTGAMAEKCIYGRTKMSHSNYSESFIEKEFQYSVFAGAGIQLNFNNHIALYAEPLATYYFDNGSNITNIYKDRPLNFDLRIGLRYTFK